MAQTWNKDIDRLLTITPDGADSALLRTAMKNFHTAWQDMPPSGAAVDPAVAAKIDAAVVEIAGALNWDAGEARQVYEKFKLVAKEESKNDLKEQFVGSKEHLLFGHVVGEVLDLKPVFGALLSPTGGMVGPGAISFHVKEGVLAFHGVAHDAGGYLCRCHNEDPGYEYIKKRESPECEADPLKGQISGIFFWVKKLNLGWLNFLAAADPVTLIGAAPVEDIASFLEPGRIAAAETTPSGRADGDGIVLNEAEVRFLQVLITQDAREGDEELVAEGLASLKQKGLVSGDEEEGYQVTDQLVMAMAITLEPELELEASPTALAAAEQTLRYYKVGDYLVEHTTPAPGQMRLAGLRDAGHAQERLLQVMPLAESELGAISLSLTGDQFETAVDSAAAGALDPAAGLGLDPAAAGVVADLASALDSGQVVGIIRLRQYDGQTEIKKRELQFVQGGQATWLVSREGEQGQQVDIALASPASISQQLGLTSAAES